MDRPWVTVRATSSRDVHLTHTHTHRHRHTDTHSHTETYTHTHTPRNWGAAPPCPQRHTAAAGRSDDSRPCRRAPVLGPSKRAACDPTSARCPSETDAAFVTWRGIPLSQLPCRAPAPRAFRAQTLESARVSCAPKSPTAASSIDKVAGQQLVATARYRKSNRSTAYRHRQ